MSTVTLVLLAIASVSLYATLVTSQSAPYRLRVERHDPSSQGSTVDLIILQCVDQSTGQVLPPRNVVFWLNRVRPEDPDFKDKDYVLIDDNLKRILFQLREEGYYTCGIRVDGANVQESERVPLIGE